MTDNLNWFAFRTFRNGRKSFIKKLTADGVYSYVPEKTVVKIDPVRGEKSERQPIFANLVFVRATAAYVQSVQYDSLTLAFPYLEPGTKQAAIIPDAQMDNFIEVLRLGGDSLEAFEGDLSKGDRVRVLSGVFQGREGFVARVKGSKKFIVSIEGIAAVATIFIPRNMLERLA